MPCLAPGGGLSAAATAMTITTHTTSAAVNSPAVELPAGLTRGRFVGLLMLLVAAAYPKILLGWESFYIRDFAYFGYPLAAYHRECFWRGEIPLWNPLSMMGLPFAAQWNTLVFYPGSLIYLLLPLPWSLNLFCLLHQVLAGAGMYLLAERWTGSRLAAAVAGLGFAFNGLTLNCLMWPNNIAALGWMPLVILFGERAFRGDGRAVLAAALVGATQMLTGAPEIILFTWGTLGLFAVGWSREERRAGRDWRRAVGRLALTGVIVAGLAALQLAPFLELLRNSHRSTGQADAAMWSMPAWGWANLVVPRFRTFASAVGVCFQAGQDWTTSYYPGIGVLALALVGVGLVRQWRTWLLGGLLVLSLLLALGDNTVVYPFLRKVFPPVGFFRFPVKFVVLATFCFPLLAAYAVAHLAAPGRADERGSRWVVIGVGVGLTLVAAVIVACSYGLPLRGEAFSASWQHGVGRVSFLAAILGLVLAWRRPSPHVQRLGLALALALAVAGDGLTHTGQQNPGIKPELYAPGLLREHWKQTGLGVEIAPGGLRAWTPAPAYEVLLRRMVPDAGNDYLCHRMAQFADSHLLDQLPFADGFYSLYLREAHQIWSLLYFAPPGRKLEPLLDFAGVAAMPSTTNIFHWEARRTARPLVTIGQAPVFADEEATLHGLRATNFNPRTTVFLPENARGLMAEQRGLSGVEAGERLARIVGQRFSAERIELEVEAPTATMLVVAQAYYPGWRATIDGQPVRVLRANHAFQALALPAGARRVTLVYEDRVFQAGVAVTAFTGLACCGWLGRKRRGTSGGGAFG